MKIETGYLYHIKDNFFDVVNDDNLMSNHERGNHHSRIWRTGRPFNGKDSCILRNHGGHGGYMDAFIRS